MKVLIFGGTGAIGIPVVQLLAERGHEVYVTSRKSKKLGLHYICGNDMDLEFVKSILGDHQYDVLIDFMAYMTSSSNRDMNTCWIMLEDCIILVHPEFMRILI